MIDRNLSQVFRKQAFASFLMTLFFVIFISGCGTLGSYNAATGKKEFILVSTAEEVAMGESVDQNLRAEYKYSSNRTMISRVEGIGRKIAQVSDRQDYSYNFFVIEKDELNAFTTPGGNIYIFTGLLNKLTTDAQIAAVIAHETGHCAAKHVVKKYQTSLGYDIVKKLVLGQLDSSGRAAQVVSMSSGTIMNLVLSKYSRGDEFAADKLGVKYMYLAGYDLNGIVETLAILDKESKGDGGLLILRSHPYLKDRIESVKKEIQAVKS
ncbi:MAG: M48 family metalloprotease [Candidatus Omnitrophica bacterium]|nr:M48 family metalloprotease [Candidatus Omnitrophota bacterium]MBU4333195.1 M48 family metalloprotease [Candidatus Omnitrophota bacterium]